MVPFSRVPVFILGGTMPRPMHASHNIDHHSMPTIYLALVEVWSRLNYPNMVLLFAKSMLSKYSKHISGVGLALCLISTHLPNYGTPLLAMMHS
jgi:hypothetical protein